MQSSIIEATWKWTPKQAATPWERGEGTSPQRFVDKVGDEYVCWSCLHCLDASPVPLPAQPRHERQSLLLPPSLQASLRQPKRSRSREGRQHCLQLVQPEAAEVRKVLAHHHTDLLARASKPRRVPGIEHWQQVVLPHGLGETPREEGLRLWLLIGRLRMGPLEGPRCLGLSQHGRAFWVGHTLAHVLHFDRAPHLRARPRSIPLEVWLRPPLARQLHQGDLHKLFISSITAPAPPTSGGVPKSLSSSPCSSVRSSARLAYGVPLMRDEGQAPGIVMQSKEDLGTAAPRDSPCCQASGYDVDAFPLEPLGRGRRCRGHLSLWAGSSCGQEAACSQS
jgi:hypothetical protein